MRRAVSYSVLLFMTWLMVPLLASLLVPKLFPGVPRFIMAANAWVLASSPMGLVFRIVSGATGAALMRAVARMSGLQLVGGVVFVVWSIARAAGNFESAEAVRKTDSSTA